MNDFMSYEKKNIEICEVDYMGRYQLCHLFNRFAELATINAMKIGLWNVDMMANYGWVVAKQTLHLEEPICHGDVIELSTIAGRGSFVSFPRYYFIHKNNQRIGYCSSIWTLIDIQNRRIVAPRKIGLKIPQFDHDISLEKPHDIDMNIEMKYHSTRQVQYSDVDTNQHMNNTRYIQWALDIIDYSIHQSQYISDLTIQYKKEIRPLEMVQLYLGHIDNRYVVQGKNAQGEEFFLIEFIFV